MLANPRPREKMPKILSKYKIKLRDYKAASKDERELADWIVTDLTFGYYQTDDVNSARFSRQNGGEFGLMNLILMPAKGYENARLFAFTREGSDNVAVNANGVPASDELYAVDKPLINGWIVLVTNLDGKWVTYHWEDGQYVTTDPSATQVVELPQATRDERDPEAGAVPPIGTRISFARKLKDATQLEMDAWDALHAGPAQEWDGFVSRLRLGKDADPADLKHYDVLFKVRRDSQDTYSLAIAMADRRGGFTDGFSVSPWEVLSVYALELQPGDAYLSLRCVTPTGDVILYWGEGGYSTPS